ncbi:MAG: hypothetical protein KOO60_00660 [Gemmatimonadales bacterium]|nr:hypothetical protein [Gemmatimonadales bacterium]
MNSVRTIFIFVAGIVLATCSVAYAAANAADFTAPGEWEESTRYSPRLSPRHDNLHYGEAPAAASGLRDTVLIMGPWGSGAPFNGQFESSGGASDWNGWTGIDLTQPVTSAWHVDTYNAAGLNGHEPGNLAAWCGSITYPSCQPDDPEGGYGHDYFEMLNWYGQVADTASPCTVEVDAWVNHNTEPGYDYCHLQFITGDGNTVEVWTADGIGINVNVQGLFTYAPSEYVGAGQDQVHVQWLVTSDGYWDDADCSYYGDGACQLDDVTVTLDNGVVSTFDDFEDGTLGNWEIGYQHGAGNFASLRTGLHDLDPCSTNLSAQVTFIDDGLVVPGTGGSLCMDWCYGPGGYIVSTTGGLSDVWTAPVHNAVVSPIMPFPQDKDGSLFSFDVYVHEDLSMGSPGIFYTWKIRSTSSTNPLDIENEEWQDRDFVYYGLPEYRRVKNNVSDLLALDAQYIQVRLAVYHIFYLWAWCPCDNGYPAPYFDNVRVDAFDIEGPSLLAYDYQLAQDNFPANGNLDLEDLGNNSVRFDMADGLGDSLIISATPLSPGAVLNGTPEMHYRLAANPVFDPYRTAGFPVIGQVSGELTAPDSDHFFFDLPDAGFLFPGDILHYYFTATDELAGDLRTTFLPADTTGFSNFTDPLTYQGAFTFRALPSVHLVDETLVIPEIVVWDNTGNPDTRNEWYFALANLGLHPGQDYDLFTSQASAVAEGNGLGGVSTLAQISPYEILGFSGGKMGRGGIGFAESSSEPSPDIELLDGWLRLGGRRLLLTGDRVAEDLDSDPIPKALLTDWVGIEYMLEDLRPAMDDQYSPGVTVLPGNPVFTTPEQWVVNGMCPQPAILNGVTAIGTGVQLAEFTNRDGEGSAYPYAAAVWNVVPEFDAQVIMLPYDFSRIGTSRSSDSPASKAEAPLAARSLVLADILSCFDYSGGGIPSGLPQVPGAFSVVSYPNPFNPTTRIEFNLPREDVVSLKIYNLRGELVRGLIDGVLAAGPGFVDWDGVNDSGARVSSGAYFYVIKTRGESRTGKMTLLK